MRYELTIDEVLNWNGVLCSPSKVDIVFETPDCGDIVCIKADNKITVEIPDGCNQRCFYGTAVCEEDCDGCGVRRIEICPCQTNLDCGPCSLCNPATHVCVTKCGPGEICSEECGGCAECDSDNPCANGKACNGCKCECPTDKPYEGPNGNCIDCRTKDDCPPCHECTPDGCKPIVCETGICHPTKNTCVECLTKNDCEGPNKCCIDDKCTCCPGFVKDQEGNCIPEPNCNFDSDCKDCEYCDIQSGGKCKPIICPEGTVCMGNGCYNICDCNNPLCDSNNACIRVNDTTCGCSSCNGSCADGEPCGPGCFCDKTDDKCRPNPCTGSCENGTDCGPGCGCNPVTKKCEPCGGVPCGEPCDTLLGCGCPDGTNCTDIPDCGGDCSNGQQCPEGCGCFKGRCVNCANFDCAQCEQVDGCTCTDGTNCVPGDKDCLDVLKITKNEDNCSLIGTLDVKGKCSCSVITSGVIVTAVSTSSTELKGSFRVELRKGNVQTTGLFGNAPLLNDSINASNDLPIGGTIQVKTYAYYEEFNSTTGVFETNKVPVASESLSITNQTLINFNLIKLGNLTTPSIKLKKIDVEFYLQSKLEFVSGCEYDNTLLYTLSSNVVIVNQATTVNWMINTVTAIKNLLTDSLRKPMIIWSKTKGVHTNATIFRKVHANIGADGKYTDILYGPGENPDGLEAWPLESPEGELWAGYDYQLSSDCACDTDDLVDLSFCKPDINYELINCQKKFILRSNFTPCPVNNDLTTYDPNGILGNKTVVSEYDIPTNAQVTYNIYFNDILKHTFKGNLPNGFELVNDATITKVVISQTIDGVEHCRKQFNHPLNIAQPPYITDCGDSNGNYYSVDFEKTFISGVETYTITSITGPSIVTNVIGNVIRVTNLVKGVTTKVTVNYSSGCSTEVDLIDNCCQYANVTLSVPNSICNSGPVTITANATGFAGTVTYSWNGGTFGSSNTFVAEAAGTYTVIAKDLICGEKTASITIDSIGEDLGLVINPSTICEGGVSKITLSGTPGATYSINQPIGAPIVGTIPLTGTTLPIDISEAGIYTLNAYTVGACSYNPGITTTLTKVVNPTVTMTYANTPTCAGTPIQLVFTGTPNTIVNISSTGVLSGNAVQLSPSGIGGAFVTFNSVGSNTVTINSQTTLAGLCGNFTTQSFDLTSLIVQSPAFLSGVANCESNSPSSLIDITVVATAGSLITSPLGSFGSETPHSPGFSTYKLENVSPVPGSTLIVTAVSPISNICSDTIEITIPTCTCPTINVTATGTNVCPGDSGTLVSGAISGPGTYTYQWYTGAGVAISGATSANYTTTTPGNYFLIVSQVGSSCTGVSNVVALTNTANPNPNVVLVGPPVFYPNMDYTYNVAIVPGMVVTGFTSSTLTIVSSSGNNVVVSSATAGTKTFTVTYTYMGCTFTKVVTMEVTSCYALVVGISGVTANSCGDLTATASGGTSPYTYAWTGTGDMGTVVSQATNVFDASVLLANENITVTVVATDANGCTGSANIVYDRCSCICSGLSCEGKSIVSFGVTQGANVPVVKTLGLFESGRSFKWLLNSIGTGNSMKAVLKVNGTIFFDTGWITRSSSSCGLTLCEGSIQYLGDDPAATVNLTGGTTETGVTAPLLGSGCDRLANNSGLVGGITGFIYGIGLNVTTVPTDGLVTMELTRGTCTGSDGFPVAFAVECV